MYNQDVNLVFFFFAIINKLLMILYKCYNVLRCTFDYFIVSSVQIYYWKKLQKSINEMK